MAAGRSRDGLEIVTLLTHDEALFTLDGTWAGNVFQQFYRRIYPKLVKDLKVPFRLETPELFRRDETPVHEAIREALVNAMIHADYSGTTGIRIFKRPDSFEFINPGELRLPLYLVWPGAQAHRPAPGAVRQRHPLGGRRVQTPSRGGRAERGADELGD